MRITASYQKLAPGAYEGMMQIYRYVRASGLEPGLLLLVELRASQLNGCAFCMDMHATEALQGGESPRRLHTLAGWRDAPFFSPRERAALGWTERLTLLPGNPVDEEQYQEMLKNLHREGAGRPHLRDHPHQRLEPPGCRLPARPARGGGGPMIRFDPHHRPELEAIRQLYAASPLRRPIQDPDRIRRMFDGANVVHSAWDGGRLVGVLRPGPTEPTTATSATWPCTRTCQKSGIGAGLLALLPAEYPVVRWVLLASPLARDYYAKVGWRALDNAWSLAREGGPVPSYEDFRTRFADLAERPERPGW